MTGVQFPLTTEALQKLAQLKDHKISLVQLVSYEKSYLYETVGQLFRQTVKSDSFCRTTFSI